MNETSDLVFRVRFLLRFYHEMKLKIEEKYLESSNGKVN